MNEIFHIVICKVHLVIRLSPTNYNSPKNTMNPKIFLDVNTNKNMGICPITFIVWSSLNLSLIEFELYFFQSCHVQFIHRIQSVVGSIFQPSFFCKFSFLIIDDIKIIIFFFLIVIIVLILFNFFIVFIVFRFFFL